MKNSYKEDLKVPAWVWFIVWSLFVLIAIVEFNTTRDIIIGIIIPTVITPIAALLNKYYD